MSSSKTGTIAIKEALAVLTDLEAFGRVSESRIIAPIRTALESAQREAEAWEAIEAWICRDELTVLIRLSPIAS